MHNWYSLTTEELYEVFRTTRDGLSASEARRRLGEYGRNELKLVSAPWWRRVIEPFANVFVLVLAVAAVVSLLSHEPLDAIIIAGTILISALIYYVQDYSTSRILRKLRLHAQYSCSVMRDGEIRSIPVEQLVPGDVVLPAEGQKIAADIRLFHVSELKVNESVLTGESLPIAKHANPLSGTNAIYDQHNMLFSGTYVVSGQAMGVVVETGNQTEFGKIATLSTQTAEPSPAQVKIDRVVSQIIKVMLGVSVVTFALGIGRGLPPAEALRFMLSMAVSAVPEGLPVALTIITVLGMRRLAGRQVLVRSFRALEDVGLVTVIATDKTGTLTQNKLAVADTWTFSDSAQLESLSRLTLAKKAGFADPLDEAISLYHAAWPHGHKSLVIYPFSQDLRMSGAAVSGPKGNMIVIKGAPESVVKKSLLSPKAKRATEEAIHRLASEGYRVIAIAQASIASPPKDLASFRGKYDFVGLLAIADGLRTEAPAAIAKALTAGIQVKMITGDHVETAFGIGRRLMLATEHDQAINTASLRGDQAWAKAVARGTVFARVLPEDKYRILQLLEHDEVVAMTGDGVNDAPALAKAHVGIAMGSGTDIAKDAADMVLLDDRFSSIIVAIHEGRVIYDNIRKLLFYLISTSFGEVATMIGALLIGLPLPVSAVQILWINLVTDTAMVLPIGLEPAESDVMSQPPRRPDAPILERFMMIRTIGTGVLMAVGSLCVFAYFLNSNSFEYASSLTFGVLVVAQWANAFNARSERQSILKRIRTPNIKLWAGLAIGAALQWMAMYGPLQSALGTVSVRPFDLLFASLAVIVPLILVVEAHKLWLKVRV